MKFKPTCLSLLLVSLLFAKQTSSQVLCNPNTHTLTPDLKTTQYPELNLKKTFENPSENAYLKNLPGTTPKAKLLSGNQKFDIYILPLDNTPCLVPNKTFKGNMKTMPQTFNSRKEQGNKIPNPFKIEHLIPRQK